MKKTDLSVLIVGGGAREHALFYKMIASPRVTRAFCTPGNGGIPAANRRDVKDTDIDGIIQLAKELRIDLVIFGPEAPLVAGGVERVQAEGIMAFGPSARAAELEGSKIFTMKFCQLHGIPVGDFRIARTQDEAVRIIRTTGFSVIKADGLCGGKGVTVADSVQDAIEAARKLLVDKIYGDAEHGILIQERLTGPECSFMALCDGINATVLPIARDYKRAFDGDKGPNTGGMGCYAPLPDVDAAMQARIMNEIIVPTLRGMAEAGTPYHGLLYGGIMLTRQGPMLIEYNVRFGDPETQTVLPLIQSDIVEYMLASLKSGRLSKLGPLILRSGATVCTVLASEGYPGYYQAGYPITGLEEATRDLQFVHAGTALKSGELVTSGGRVMSSVGYGEDLATARTLSQAGAELITFENKFFRSDIAANVP